MICGVSYQQFRNVIKNNQLPNCPYTVDDVDAAEEIFGRSLQCLKGNTTRRQTIHVRGAVTSLPPEILKQYHHIILSADVIFINHLKLFVTKLQHINFTTVELLGNNKGEPLLKSILNQ